MRDFLDDIGWGKWVMGGAIAMIWSIVAVVHWVR